MFASVVQPLNGQFEDLDDSDNSGSHHKQNMINGQFGQINLDGPNTDLRAVRDAGTPVPDHEVTLRFRFVNRDTGAAISIPWLQFSLFDFDENKPEGKGDSREARAAPPHRQACDLERSP